MFDITAENIEAAPKIPFSLANWTVVSLLPYPIRETKPSIIPGYFQIPACRNGIPSVLPVGESIHWLESPFAGNPPPPPIKMTHSPREIATSLVNDLVEAQLAIDSDALPGLFCVEGHKNSTDIMTDCKTQLRAAEDRQQRWFINLVRLADDDWSQYHKNQSISDIQRYAAKSLGLKREWLTTTLEEVNIQCPLCKEYVRADAIVHSACGYIMKPEEYAELKGKNLILEVTK